MSTKSNLQKLDLLEYVSKHGFNVGFKIPPNTHVEIKGVKNEESGQTLAFHLTNACLGIEAVKGERACLTLTDLDAEESNEIMLASLSTGVNENVILDLILQGDFVLGNVNADGSAIHVLGRVSADDEQYEEDGDYEGEEYDDDDDDDDYEDDDEEEEGMLFDDDDEDEDYEDDDDDAGFAPKSKVKIEQIPSDDEAEANGNGHEAKKAKLITNEPATKKKASEDKPKAKPTAGDEKKAETKPKNVDNKPATEPVKKTAVPKDKPEAAGKKDAEGKDKKANAKAEAKNHDASKGASDSKVAADKVISFIKETLKSAKAPVKGTDLGTAVSNHFKTPLKKMGFEEKTLSKFVEKHANGEINYENDAFSLKSK